MSDFDDALIWAKQPTDADVAQALRKNVRKYRTERGRHGHRFSMKYLKTVWSAADDLHVVLNHVDDPTWQMWYQHPDKGWTMISWHGTRREAQAAAEGQHVDRVEPIVAHKAGINLLAGWADEPYRRRRTEVDFTMRIHCQTERTVSELEEIFSRLGCLTKREMVSAE